MRPIRPDEIKDAATYERIRPKLRKKIVELRNLRRLQLGEKISIVFENRETVLYQLQEMLRAERIFDDEAIQHEIDAFTELLPKPRHLAGTLFLELTDPEKMREELEEFLGLDQGQYLWFDLGDLSRVYAHFGEGPTGQGRMPSVHYVQFPFTEEGTEAFRRLSHPVRLIIEHPAHQATAVVDGPSRQSLAEDLAEE